jgi:thiamine phosphate synthase YjbQ (UPF0047 family)
MNFKIKNSYLSFKTSGDTDVIDITAHVSRKVAESGLTEGQVLIFVPGSTAAVTTIAYGTLSHGSFDPGPSCFGNLATDRSGRFR